MDTCNTPHGSIVWKLNMLGLFGIALILTIAFYYQLAHGELPCPLCLLQRAGFIAIGMGFLFNLRVGERGAHYAMILVGSLVTGIISIRQVSLHLPPGDAGFGSTLLGLHFYTWSLIATLGFVCYVALMFVAKDRVGKRAAIHEASGNSNASRAMYVLFMLLVAANLLSTVLECGAGQCDDNPIHYQLLKY
ncbi:disulfide bond formation protein B [Caballeronia sp. LZ065]|uniref:disulfide bond formation protein B n=1 Tax=Caballeronia sp. LZ065 TaxID=3038571 RepID=UPI002857F2FD|nr:disulfide bond formation protein B [Caballeronia sp. LZ065]MDR5781026.1 disulfide bond formation protein B [Caballeronia sp. LZ065]